MAKGDQPSEGTWDIGWEGHDLAQLLRMANLPLRDKLKWLEEAQILVEHFKSQWKHPKDKATDGGDALREGGHE